MLRKDRFDEREADFYEAMYTQSQAQFDAYVDSGTLLNNYSHVFDLLIKLRQVLAEADNTRHHPLALSPSQRTADADPGWCPDACVCHQALD